MDFNDLINYFTSLPDQVLDDTSKIVAETATEYYKERFKAKEFDGNPWAPTRAPRANGSLLINSGNLLNSIRPAYVGHDKVIISAGNEKVNYAQVHNEGYTGPVNVPAHIRHTKKWGDVNVKDHTRNTDIPQRQFMGQSNELADKIHARLQGYINTLK
ncbi:phage virion morphogenesis protein [Parabacteroides goldsteinii]|uniref:phage virion morphogenesis protein n=1 Tax=Parabacteroides goldsteinii TaxID=328812 RepID=UPI001CC9B619|nr:phage virion morphogenesis protein [Parabacteroides goldsteinii]UBD75698.1 phage virion morphogenesis protein [Parabacteroides goldsteinii]